MWNVGFYEFFAGVIAEVQLGFAREQLVRIEPRAVEFRVWDVS